MAGTCDGTGSHYFYADGGCNQNFPVSEDLGPADLSPHEYRVASEITTSGLIRWDFYVDNVRRKYLFATDAAVNCWITGDRDSQWFGETWDGGDGYADTGNRLNFTLVKYKSDLGTTWHSPGWSAANPCNHSAENSVGLDYKCDVVGADKFDIWSVAW